MKIPDSRMCFHCACCNEVCATGENTQVTVNSCVIIRQEYSNTDLDVSYLKKKLNVSFGIIEDSFNVDLLRPPLTVIHLYRMEKAIELLYKTDLPLSHIARKTGYSVKKTFLANFKKYYQVSPNAMRERLRDSENPVIIANEEINNAWIRSQKYDTIDINKCREKK